MNDSLFDLHGQNALITGSNRGLGLALAGGLAQHGADVALLARTEDQLAHARSQIQTATDRTVWTFPFDLTDTDAIADCFERILTDTEHIDILVNCAGVNLRGPAEEISLQTWRQVFDVNLNAAFAFSTAFCRHRKACAAPGKILNIGSLACAAARPTTAPYTASKGALAMLTKSLAVEWAPYHINVNAIGPGYFQTEMTKPLLDNEDFSRWVISRTPLNRWGQPEDLIGAALLLTSPAGNFITGQIIYVDGGWLAAL